MLEAVDPRRLGPEPTTLDIPCRDASHDRLSAPLAYAQPVTTQESGAAAEGHLDGSALCPRPPVGQDVEVTVRDPMEGASHEVLDVDAEVPDPIVVEGEPATVG